ncbi:MAG: MoaD/ThiS family protein [Mycobacteriaceae bacterium]|jgi:molybdopterin converting factor small subunit
MTDITPTVEVTVRFFAAACSAAGTESDVMTLKPGATVADAVRELCGQSDELALVLQKCSYLCDGVAVRDQTLALLPHQTLDVLPPFAGG